MITTESLHYHVLRGEEKFANIPQPMPIKAPHDLMPEFQNF